MPFSCRTHTAASLHLRVMETQVGKHSSTLIKYLDSKYSMEVQIIAQFNKQATPRQKEFIWPLQLSHLLHYGTSVSLADCDH